MSDLPSFVTALESWAKLFYSGQRLQAEVVLHASALSGQIEYHDLRHSLSLISRSFGIKSDVEPVIFLNNYFSSFSNLPIGSISYQHILPVSELPDAYMFWILSCRLSRFEAGDMTQRTYLLNKLATFIYLNLPSRPDLLSLVLLSEGSHALYKDAPSLFLSPGQCYSRADAYLPQLQVAWVNGRYEMMWLSTLRGQIDGREIALSDHHVRGFSVLGNDQVALGLFIKMYHENPSQFKLPTISNMIFMLLGSSVVDQPFLKTLSSHFNQLADTKFFGVSDTLSTSRQKLSINEKPTLVVVSSDLRQHPVGRFWLPIARSLRSHFHVISVVGHPRDQDPIRTEIASLSDEWWTMEPCELLNITSRIHNLNASILVDLGGHTADNYPQLLTQRLSTLQVTYLGFYGPTYAKHCDWWIIDDALSQWISNSYPGAEPLWSLPGSSLCYLPDLHSLPEPDDIPYRESKYAIYGSFNHTRKITPSTRHRFREVLAANPHAVLRFRSHSFRDPAVRRLFISRFKDSGIPPHQLESIPFAPSFRDAMLDYARINLHLDTSPVSGTTTTMDSLLMGIPVLTTPTPYYAGAISSAILSNAGLADHICEDPFRLPEHAKWLADRYRSADSRRSLASHVRQSSLCNSATFSKVFIDQLGLMLRQKQAA